MEKLQTELYKNLSKDGNTYMFGENELLGQIYKCISTQSVTLDRIIAKDINGNCGVPCGRISFIAGKPSSGKTTISSHLCAETQKEGGIAFYIDSEHRLDKEYAKKIGVNIDNLIYSGPKSLEEVINKIIVATDTIKEFRSKNSNITVPVLIVVDSLSIATLSEKEKKSDKNLEKQSSGAKGEHSRILSSFFRSIVPEIVDLNIAIWLVNQIKTTFKIGQYGGNVGESFIGESPIKFHSTIGLRIQKIKILKDNNNCMVSDVSIVESIKNSAMIPHRKVEVQIDYAKGINKEASLFELMEEDDLIKSAGAWYTIGENKFQGKEKVYKWLQEEDNFNIMMNKIKEKNKKTVQEIMLLLDKDTVIEPE